MSVIERERVEAEAPPITKRDLLHRAADLLEEFEWCQGDWGSKRTGKFCAHGALINATLDFGLGPNFGDGSVYEQANLTLRDLTGGILSWNDQADRTKAEVIAKLREAAEV